MKYQLPFDPYKLKKEQQEKWAAMQGQPTNYADYQGNLVADRKAEFESRYEYYRIRRTNHDAVQIRLADGDQAQYLEAFNNIKKDEAEIKILEKEILELLAEPIDESEDQQRRSIKKALVKTGIDPRPRKTAVFPSNRGRVSRAALPQVPKPKKIPEDPNLAVPGDQPTQLTGSKPQTQKK